jgi:hypothetical protein
MSTAHEDREAWALLDDAIHALSAIGHGSHTDQNAVPVDAVLIVRVQRDDDHGARVEHVEIYPRAGTQPAPTRALIAEAGTLLSPRPRRRRRQAMTATQGEASPHPAQGAPHGIGAAPSASFFYQRAGEQERSTGLTEGRLRAVKAGEKAPVKRAPRKAAPKSVVAAARSGDRRQLLVALQNRIAKALDDPKTAGPAFAALIKQQRDIAAEIHAIDLAAEARSLTSGPQTAIAMTPDEPWDESMI